MRAGGGPARGASASRLMIIENDSMLASGLARALKNEGYDVTVAESGEAGLEAFSATRFDLLVLDIDLPGVDGFEVLEGLGAMGQSLPVLVVSARDGIDERVRALDAGADGYLIKPFTLPELAARLRALGRRRRAKAEPTIRHGPLVLEASTRRVSLGGKPLELTGREWSVLEVLLQRVEKTVSKETICEAIAGSSQGLSLNAIEANVSRLRAKLGSGEIRIRTVRGFGYMLESREPVKAVSTE